MARVYRNICVPLRILGLGLFDLMVLLLLFLIIFNVSDHLILNTVALIFCYGLVRFSSKGKPEGYLLHLLKFMLSPTERHVALERKK